jgi:hypothetical protein
MITASSVIAGTGLCFWLLYQAREVDSTLWFLQHILCPIVRIIVLFIIVSQIYPALDSNSTSVEFWRVLSQQGQFNDLLNILFFVGLLMAFMPLVNHPVLALPIQSGLTIALVFHWQYAESIPSLQLFPSAATILKIVVYMLLAYLATREASIHLSRWIDKKLVISGSIRLVSDAIYLVLQIPVMLIYCSFLKLQLP